MGRTEKSTKNGKNRRVPASQSNDDLLAFRERFSACLLQRGLRSTNQRRTVTDVFFRSEGHYSIEELLLRVREVDPGIGYATVYRTVKLLADCKLASERRFGDGVARYEVAREDEHHDHLMCVDCGRIIEFENDKIEELQVQIAKAHGFELRSHRLDLWGECQTKDCVHRASKGQRAAGAAVRRTL